MKVAVTYGEDEMVLQHFGHTERFKIYTVEDGKVLSGGVVDTAGAGHEALATFLAKQGVDTLICGGIGPGAVNALGMCGIRVFGGITGLADLIGRTVGVSSGSTSARELVRAMVEQGLVSGDNFDPDTFDATTWTEGVSFHQYDDYPTISTALSAGEVDAFCVDRSILAIYKTEGRSYIQDAFAPQEYGIATTKGSGLSEVCEELVTTWLSDGTIDGLIAEYGL